MKLNFRFVSPKECKILNLILKTTKYSAKKVQLTDYGLLYLADSMEVLISIMVEPFVNMHILVLEV